MKISVSDYIFERIYKEKVRDVFMVSGGGIMHLTDALYRNSKLRYWCNYHEQASAIAAEGYARINKTIGVCLVTTGPGSTNTITGVAGAWVDSIPMLVLSGQVRTQIIADYSYQRQVGPQEIDIISSIKPFTKYSKTLMRPSDIVYELEKAIYLANSGRPGPVWLNIPLDVQSAIIDLDKCKNFLPPSLLIAKSMPKIFLKAFNLIKESSRPVLILGNGVRLSNSEKFLDSLLKILNIPILTTMSSMDLIPENHSLFQGRIGPGGQRRANFALQNSDLVIAIGTSLSISCIGFSDQVAPGAKKILVNIDKGDLDKKNIKIDLKILADAGYFICNLKNYFTKYSYIPNKKWINTCKFWKKNYSTLPDQNLLEKKYVDIYLFYEYLSKKMSSKDILVTGNSLDGCVVAYQNYKTKKGQRAFTSVCMGGMGWDLPAIIGATVAAAKETTGVLVTGDGSILFNIHELMTISLNKLNIKIFISNNDGYQCMRNTQDRFFDGRQIGADNKSGVGNPNFRDLAKAFGIRYLKINNNNEILDKINDAFSDTLPCFVELIVSRKQKRFRVTSYKKSDGSIASRPLEDMDPLLSREELKMNMSFFNTNYAE